MSYKKLLPVLALTLNAITFDASAASAAAGAGAASEENIFSPNANIHPRSGYAVYADIKAALAAEKAAADLRAGVVTPALGRKTTLQEDTHRPKSVLALKAKLQEDAHKFAHYSELLEIAQGILANQSAILFKDNAKLKLAKCATEESNAQYAEWSQYLEDTRELFIKWGEKAMLLNAMLEDLLLQKTARAPTLETAALTSAETAAAQSAPTAETSAAAVLPVPAAAGAGASAAAADEEEEDVVAVSTSDEMFVQAITGHMETRGMMRDGGGLYAKIHDDNVTLGQATDLVTHIKAKLERYSTRSCTLEGQFPGMAIDTTTAEQLLATKAVGKALEDFRAGAVRAVEEAFKASNYIGDSVDLFVRGIVTASLNQGSTLVDSYLGNTIIRVVPPSNTLPNHGTSFALSAFKEELVRRSNAHHRPGFLAPTKRIVQPLIDRFVDEALGKSVVAASTEYNRHGTSLVAHVFAARAAKWQTRLAEVLRLQNTLKYRPSAS